MFSNLIYVYFDSFDRPRREYYWRRGPSGTSSTFFDFYCCWLLLSPTSHPYSPRIHYHRRSFFSSSVFVFTLCVLTLAKKKEAKILIPFFIQKNDIKYFFKKKIISIYLQAFFFLFSMLESVQIIVYMIFIFNFISKYINAQYAVIPI